jgi:predicted lipid-binding transport protein (Tim44 family)
MPRRQQASAYQDPEQAPSAKWGWHGAFPRGIRIAGVLSIIIMLGLMFPHDQALGRTHLLWLGGFVLLILIAVLRPQGWRQR